MGKLLEKLVHRRNTQEVAIISSQSFPKKPSHCKVDFGIQLLWNAVWCFFFPNAAVVKCEPGANSNLRCIHSLRGHLGWSCYCPSRICWNDNSRSQYWQPARGPIHHFFLEKSPLMPLCPTVADPPKTFFVTAAANSCCTKLCYKLTQKTQASKGVDLKNAIINRPHYHFLSSMTLNLSPSGGRRAKPGTHNRTRTNCGEPLNHTSSKTSWPSDMLFAVEKEYSTSHSACWCTPIKAAASPQVATGSIDNKTWCSMTLQANPSDFSAAWDPCKHVPGRTGQLELGAS